MEKDFEVFGIAMSIRPGRDGASVVSADLGLVEESDADALAKEMLAANHAFQGTAGATLAIDPAAGRVFLRKRIWMNEDDFGAHLPELAVFADKAKEWRDRIGEKNAPDPSNLFSEIV